MNYGLRKNAETALRKLSKIAIQYAEKGSATIEELNGSAKKPKENLETTIGG